MRSGISVIFVTACMVAGVAILPVHHQGAGQEEENELQESVANSEWQLLRVADPVTGRVPSGKVMDAYRILQQRGFYQPTAPGFKTESETGWHQINDFFPSLSVTKITYDPNNTHTFYFCTGEGWYNADAIKGAGIFKSTDGGDTWFQLASTDTSLFDYCQDIVVHPLTSDIYVATKTAGLLRSTDGGNSWQTVLAFGTGSEKNSVCDIELTADGGVFASIGIFQTDGIYFSPSGDAGTFVKQTSGLPTSGYYRIEMATAPSDANVAYAIFGNSTDYKVKGIYKTNDKGATWTEVNRPENNYEFAAKQSWYDLSMGVDPNDANTVVIGGLNIWRSRDAGESWQRLTSGGLDSNLIRYVHVDQHEVTFRNSNEVYFGNDGGIWRCTNFSDEIPFIYNRNYGYNVTQFYSVSMHPDPSVPELMGGTQDNGTPFTYDDGIADYKFVSGADGAFTAFNYQEPWKFYSATQLRKLFRFDNNGMEPPDTITNPNLTDGNTLFINPFDIDATDPEIIYQCSNKGLWRLKNASTADSTEWTKCANINGVLSAIGTSPAAPGVIFMGRSSGAGDIYRIDDVYNSDGETVPFNADPNDMLPDAPFTSTIYCSSIVVDRNNADHVVVTYSNYNTVSIWESDNALDLTPSWTSIEGDLPDIPVYWSAIHPANNNVMYIATELGVFYTNLVNGTATHWIPCTSFPAVRTDMLRIRPADNMLFAATHGRGLWQALLDPAAMVNDINWNERGPNNVGGRTRTIMVDPNDPTGNTVWAGSVAGGLWKTTNINAVPVENNLPAVDYAMVFPNPAHGSINIQLQLTGNADLQINLMNINGEIAESIYNRNASGNFQLNYTFKHALPPGIYFIVIRTGERQIVKKIILS